MYFPTKHYKKGSSSSQKRHQQYADASSFILMVCVSNWRYIWYFFLHAVLSTACFPLIVVENTDDHFKESWYHFSGSQMIVLHFCHMACSPHLSFWSIVSTLVAQINWTILVFVMKSLQCILKMMQR